MGWTPSGVDRMGKGLVIFGLILIIIGILPIILNAFSLSEYAMYISISHYIPSIDYTWTILGQTFNELMVILIGLGVLLLIIGAVK